MAARNRSPLFRVLLYDHAMRILILGGTSEASALARALADGPHDALLSLAGRTSKPAPGATPMRIGGFGGADGLAAFLRAEKTDIVIDATHPFATRISANAVAACAATRTPLLTILRPPWRALPDDRWTEIAGVGEIAAALGSAPRRVLLTIGATEAGAVLNAAPHHVWFMRSIEPVAIPSGLMATAINARPPFSEEVERALLVSGSIDVLVAKNAGGAATVAKLAAARALRIPVLIVRRPHKPASDIVPGVAEALDWISRHAAEFTKRGV